SPTPGRAALCALAFGWVGGWNMYFQVFANLLLLGLVLLRRGLPIRWRAGALAGAALVQAPVLLKYVAVQNVLGSFSVAVPYGGVPAGSLGPAMRPTFLQRFLHFYPAAEVPIEAAGFLGLSWTALLLAALFRPRARPWAIAALVAFWAAMGLGHGLFDVLQIFPGVSALRASGRFQVLTALFAGPGGAARRGGGPRRFPRAPDGARRAGADPRRARAPDAGLRRARPPRNRLRRRGRGSRPAARGSLRGCVLPAVCAPLRRP